LGSSSFSGIDNFKKFLQQTSWGNIMVTLIIRKGIHCFNLPQIMKDKILRDLTFDNPKYISAKKYGLFIGSDTPPKLQFFSYRRQEDVFYIPRGYLYYLIKTMQAECVEFKIEDKTTILPKLDLQFKGILRDYQKEAVEKISKYPVGVLESSTGSGKTVFGIHMITVRKQPTLIIVHTKELGHQWIKSIKDFTGYDAGILGDGKFILKDITVGIVQTVKNNMDELKDRFGHVIADECFPAGTLVDGKPIEELRIGDFVRSFNHRTNKVEKKRILHIFKKESPKELLQIITNKRRCSPSTSNHPFFTNKGYLTASQINDGIAMSDIVVHHLKEAANEGSNNKLLCMRKRDGLQRKLSLEKFFSKSKTRNSSMFRRVCGGDKKDSKIQSREISVRVEQGVLFRKDEKEQSIKKSTNSRERKSYKTNKRNSECVERRTWRERETYQTTNSVGNSSRVGNRIGCQHIRTSGKTSKRTVAEKEKTSNTFQNRCWEQIAKNSCRNRWKKSLYKRKENAGFEKNTILDVERVESVEVYECTNRQKSTGMFENNFVYNIEVEDNNNYFVDGILVHNCHRCPSTMWTDVLSQFSARYYLGLSATAIRADGLGEAIFAFIGPKIHKVDAGHLQDVGAVLKPQVIRVLTRYGYMYRGDYSSMVSDLAGNETRNRLIVDCICKDIKDHNSSILVVSDRVQHCIELQSILDSKKIKSVLLASNLSTENRKKIVADMKSGKEKVAFATVQLVGEGFDLDCLACLCLTTPIKWKGRLIQVVGRILRPKEGKHPRVYDFRDDNVAVLRKIGKERDKVYKQYWSQ